MPPPMKRAADRNAPANPLTKPKRVEYNTDKEGTLLQQSDPQVIQISLMTVRVSDERSSRIYGHCEQQNYCANQKLKAFLPHSHSPPSCRRLRERKKGLTAICNSVRFDYITRCRTLSIYRRAQKRPGESLDKAEARDI